MNRRNFLKAAGILGTPAMLQQNILANPFAFFSQFSTNENDKILVLVRLSGGNDGLNTVIGLDQIDNLRQVRGDVALSDAQITNLNTTTGLNSAMSGMSDMFMGGQLGIIQSVGYPNQNRSHFRSNDIWMSASAASEVLETGWVGRYLATDHPDYPESYPNADHPHPLAITMGRLQSHTCQGAVHNFSQAIIDPFNFTFIVPGGETPLPDNSFGSQVEFVRTVIGQNNNYGAVVQQAANAGQTLSSNYPNTNLARQLKNVATLISGGLQTKVYVVTLGGFDTHSDQLTRQTPLLQDVSQSISAFMDDLQALGIADRVLGMTFSEFGRTIRANSSNGTDHGAASPLFLFGNCVQGGVLGESPVIDPDGDFSGYAGTDMQYDFRDIYGSILVDWFDVPSATVESYFSHSFTYLPIVGSCGVLPVGLLSFVANGRDKHIELTWQTENEVNNRGFVVQRSIDGSSFRDIGWVPAVLDSNSLVNNYQYEDRDVQSGRAYYYRLQQEDVDGATSLSAIRLARLQGSAIADWEVGLPQANPINQDSFIPVYAPSDTQAHFEVIDNQGRRIRMGKVFLSGRQDNRVPLPAAGLPSGVFVWRLKTDRGKACVRKFVVR